jgi:hypothetical protein
MPITDTRRYFRINETGAIAILEDEEGNVIVRKRTYAGTEDFECKDIYEAEVKFGVLVDIFKSCGSVEDSERILKRAIDISKEKNKGWFWYVLGVPFVIFWIYYLYMYISYAR